MNAKPTDADKVYLNSPWFTDPAIDALTPLRNAGLEVVLNTRGRMLSEDELCALLPDAYATIAHGEAYTRRVFEAAPNLRIIARYGVGHEKIDIKAASGHGVSVTLAVGANQESVADFALALGYGLACQLRPYHARVVDLDWPVASHAGLWGRTAGIIGFGRIGQAMARRCRALLMPVLVCDPYRGDEGADPEGITPVDLDTLLREADLVSLHLPLTGSNRHMIGRRELGLMKPSAFIVNTSRGPLVDEAALVEALEGGRIGGAGLDVFEVEPLNHRRFAELDNVILTPHVAGACRKGKEMILERCVRSILAIRRGEPLDPIYLADPGR